MKKGEVKSALNVLAERGGVISGSSFNVMKSLSFHGGWKDFQRLMGDLVTKQETGLYVVQHPEYEPKATEEVQGTNPFDSETFALCASNYVLGVGDTNDFESLEGRYDDLTLTVSALARQIAPVIASIHYPYETHEELEVYRVDRAVYYLSDGAGNFRIFGDHESSAVAA